MTSPDGADAFDAFFYCTYHADLKGFSARQARRHYRRYGRREARPPNPSAMLDALQAQEVALPPDFRNDVYVALNGDLRAELRHPWQSAEHYLRHGRHHGRRYRASPPPRLTERSSTALLRRRLVQAFGEAVTLEPLVLKVHKATRAVTASASLAAPLMDPVLLARWMMTSSEAAGRHFGSLDVQLTILFRTAFEPFAIVPRSGLEVQVINRLRSLAITTEVFDAGLSRPPVTLLMLAAEAACNQCFPHAPTSDQAAALVARFFARTVPRLGLERFVTSHQRALLRAPVASTDARPLAALLLDEARLEEARAGQARGRLQEGSASADLPAPFLDQDVWLSGMDYVMSSEQLETAQLRVVAEGGRRQLCGPGFLFDDPPNASAEADWAAREAAQAWMQRFVAREREDLGLPQTLVAASAAAYPSDVAAPKAAAGVSGSGRKRLRPGNLLTFGTEGSGPRHLIGRGWHGVEAERVWSAARTAMLAINLDEDDAGPLDLFVRLSPGGRGDPQVSAWWNGRLVASLRPARNRAFTLHAHLGARHRSGRLPNILCLGVEDTFQVEGDGRRLGVALYDLMLASR